MEHLDTVIVGGGQAGLATSYYLTQQGREHIVLEQAAHAAPVWRNERWDSFTLVTPNWSLRMPGAEYDGSEPDALHAARRGRRLLRAVRRALPAPGAATTRAWCRSSRWMVRATA